MRLTLRCPDRSLARGLLTGAAVATALLAPPSVEAQTATPIRTVETNTAGVTIDLMAVERKGSVLTVKVAVRNAAERHENVAFVLTGSVTTYLVDEENGTKYYVLTDKEGHSLASEHEWMAAGHGISESVAPGGVARFWMKFPAPPPEVKEIGVFLTGAEPLEAVPITDK